MIKDDKVFDFFGVLSKMVNLAEMKFADYLSARISGQATVLAQ